MSYYHIVPTDTINIEFKNSIFVECRYTIIQTLLIFYDTKYIHFVDLILSTALIVIFVLLVLLRILFYMYIIIVYMFLWSLYASLECSLYEFLISKYISWLIISKNWFDFYSLSQRPCTFCKILGSNCHLFNHI